MNAKQALAQVEKGSKALRSMCQAKSSALVFGCGGSRVEGRGGGGTLRKCVHGVGMWGTNSRQHLCDATDPDRSSRPIERRQRGFAHCPADPVVRSQTHTFAHLALNAKHAALIRAALQTERALIRGRRSVGVPRVSKECHLHRHACALSRWGRVASSPHGGMWRIVGGCETRPPNWYTACASHPLRVMGVRTGLQGVSDAGGKVLLGCQASVEGPVILARLAFGR